MHSNYKIRQDAQNIMKKIANWQLSTNRPNLIFTLLEEIGVIFNSLDLLNSSKIDSDSTESQWPSLKGFYELINCVASLKNLSEETIKKLALNCLIITNSPFTNSQDGLLYERFLKKMIKTNPNANLTLANVIESQTDSLVKLTISQTSLSEVFTSLIIKLKY